MGLPEDSKSGAFPHQLFQAGESTTAPTPSRFPDDANSPVTVVGDKSIQSHFNLPEDVCGLKLGHYELIRQLGVGGMAAVLLARDTQLDRLVALKVLPPASALDRDTLDRFHQEAKSGAKLDHENIARVYSSGEDQGLHFLALEYIEGDTLKTLIDCKGKLSVLEALPYLYQAALGLDHAAAKGVVHRDIKPSNLLVTRQGKLKLVDLGLARSLDAPAEEALTRYGATLGTFDYLSPEQALDPRKADSRSDIYSLGCTLYHMLTGKSPVPDGTAAVKLAFHQQSKPVDPRRFCPEIPQAVVGLFEKMVEKKPENRFATPAELISAVETVAQDLKVSLSKTSSPQILSGKIRLTALTGILLLALVTSLLLLFASRQKETGPDLQSNKSPGSRKSTAGSGGQLPTPGPLPLQEQVALFDNKDAGASELAEWLILNSGKEKLEIVLHGDLDLSDIRDRSDAGLVVNAKDVVIRSAHPGRRATIRYQFDGRVVSDAWAMLALDSETVQLDGIRFMLDARESANEFRALELRGSKLSGLTIERCEFLQSGSVKDERRRMSSLAINCQGIAPAVLIRDSVFLGFKESSPVGDIRPDSVRLFGGAYGGQDAILARGYYREIRCENCLFGPHVNCFRLEGMMRGPGENPRPNSEKNGASPTGGMPVPGAMIPGMTMIPGMPPPSLVEAGPLINGDGSISLLNSSFLIGETGTIASILPGTSAALTMRRCLVDSSNNGGKTGERVLISLPVPAARLWFVGRSNRFHGITKYLDTGTEPKINSLEAFKVRLASDGLGSDEESLELAKSVWASPKPLGFLDEVEVVVSDRRASPGNLGAGILGAFQPAPLPELQWKEPSGNRFAGAEKFAGVMFYPLGKEVKASQVGRHLVVPGQTDMARNIYPNLEKAVEFAKSGDVIAIRHSGTLKVDPIKIQKVGFEVTIRPDGDNKPVLVFEGSRGNPVWIVLDRSLVTLEDLTILVDQGAQDKPLSLVALSGQASCQLRDCSVALLGGQDSNYPFLGTVYGASPVVKPSEMFQAAQPSRLGIERCLVRGFGGLVRMNSAKPMELDITESNIFLAKNMARLDASALSSSQSQSTVLSVGVSKSVMVLGECAVLVDCPLEHQSPDWLLRTQQTKWISWSDSKNCLVRMEGVLIRKEKIKDWWRGSDSQYRNWNGGLEVLDTDLQSKMLLSIDQWHEYLGESAGDWATMELPASPKREEWATLTSTKIFGADGSTTGASNSNPAREKSP